MKCGFSGCKANAAFECRKLWGNGGVLFTCVNHKPGSVRRPESLKKLPFFYDVRPIGGGK
jgi:hypothetical protein